MTKNSEEAYIDAIRTRYKEKKNSIGHINPSPAQLRNLCIRIFHDNKDSSDLYWFNSFWGFEFKEENIDLINENLSKFKALGNFLIGKNTPQDWISIEMVAILVELPERPYKKFKDIDFEKLQETTDKANPDQKSETNDQISVDNNTDLKKTEPLPETHSEDEDPINDDHPKKIAEIVSEPTIDIVDQNKKTEENSGETESEKTEKQPVDIDLTKVSEKTDTKETQPGNSSFPDTNIQSLFGPNNPNHITNKADEEKEKEKEETVIPPHRTEKRILLATFLRTNKIFLISSSFSVLVSCLLLFDKPIFGSKNRMLWKEDHYEQVDGNEPDLSEETVPFDKTLQEKFRKVAYSDTLVFFDPYGKPLIWYSKLNGGYELFTHYGKHPITDKTLKPITQTIVSNLSNDPNR